MKDLMHYKCESKVEIVCRCEDCAVCNPKQSSKKTSIFTGLPRASRPQ